MTFSTEPRHQAWLGSFTFCLLASVLVFGFGPRPASGSPFATSETNPYLLIGMGSASQVGNAVKVSNWEIGANSNAVPSPSNPSLAGNVPPIPANAQPVFQGIGGRGNVAVTSSTGTYDFSNTAIYADLGIRAQGSNPEAGFSNSTLLPGTKQFNFSLQSVRDELTAARTYFNDSTHLEVSYAQLNLTNNSGKVNKDLFSPGKFSISGPISAGASSSSDNGTFTVTALNQGVTFIDIVTAGPSSSTDLLLETYNWVIDAPDSDSFIVFRLPNTANFNVSKGNILAGNQGIGMNNILFFSDKNDNNSHFNFSNTILSGVAFWTLAGTGGEININNAQGCTQLVADKINLNDVRLNNCHFAIPEPNAMALLIAGGLLMLRRRR